MQTQQAPKRTLLRAANEELFKKPQIVQAIPKKYKLLPKAGLILTSVISALIGAEVLHRIHRPSLDLRELPPDYEGWEKQKDEERYLPKGTVVFDKK
ncbi:1 TM domain-containing transmembrane protein [Acrasis kona]|uniref:1 TM domain-containing transmembrane protein n=1 Tax=Acrasis kona TaxID=1008807 RepID=A0AAW2ZE08_9EUKA